LKNCYIIFVLFLFFSCISIAQTNSNNVDPFLGHYTLGGKADLIWFNAHPNVGYECGYDYFSENIPQQPVMIDQENRTVISTDGVSGNFLMGSVSDQAHDEAVFATVASVGDSAIQVNLDVTQLVNGAWSVSSWVIDYFNVQPSKIGQRMLIRMTSGYFDGGPAKEFAVAYNLPDSSQKITIRIFKLDSGSGKPVEIGTPVHDDVLPSSLGTQAFFDITAGDFEGNKSARSGKEHS
jgi:hypothetical protein